MRREAVQMEGGYERGVCGLEDEGKSKGEGESEGVCTSGTSRFIVI